MEWIARALGVFYVYAAVVVLRQVRMNSFLDRAMAAIEMKPTPTVERAVSASGFAIGGLTGLSGVALALLHPWAVWAFLACWLAQAVYLLWAQRWYAPEDAADVRGRRKTINAFAVYTAATLFVLWQAQQGLFSR
jgi:hypothetical protein